MKLLKKLEKELCFYYNLQERRLQINDFEELIDEREFFKLRLVFKFRRLPNYLWLKLLDCGDAKTIHAYLDRYDYPSQVSMVLRLSDERLKQLKLQDWVEEKLQSVGLAKNDYIFFAEHASSFLYRAIRFLRKSVIELNHLLVLVGNSPLVSSPSAFSRLLRYPCDLWDGGGCVWTYIDWQSEVAFLTNEKAPELINQMLLTEEEALELVNLGSDSLIDAWLSSNLLRDRVITYLDKQGIVFTVIPYLSDKVRSVLLQKKWDLVKYKL